MKKSNSSPRNSKKFRSLLKTMAEPVKVQIHQQAETVRPSNDTSTQESTTNEIDGTIV